jgi:hypothetical protein
MDSPTPEKLQLVGAVEAYPDLMPGILFVTCPDKAKSCVSVSTCQRLHDETISRKADPEACARPCSRCATGVILWRGESSRLPPVNIEHCPRCGRTGRLVGRRTAARLHHGACVACLAGIASLRTKRALEPVGIRSCSRLLWPRGLSVTLRTACLSGQSGLATAKARPYSASCCVIHQQSFTTSAPE